MANVFHLPDGTAEVLFEKDEIALRQLIEKKLGYDAVKIYDSVIEERDYYRDKVEYGYGQDENEDDENDSLADILLLEAHKAMLQKEPVVPVSSVKEPPSVSEYDDEDALPF